MMLLTDKRVVCVCMLLTYFVDSVVRKGFLLDDCERQVVGYAEDRYKQGHCNYCSLGQFHRPNPLIRRLRATVLVVVAAAAAAAKGCPDGFVRKRDRMAG